MMYPRLPVQPADEAGGSPAAKLRCRLVAAGSARPQIHLGDLEPVEMHEALGISEPSTGKTHTTILLATLGGCLVDRIRANAAIGNIALASLVVEIESDPGQGPVWGSGARPPGPVGLETIHVRVHADSDATDEAMRALISHAALWSPVANTLHAPIHVDVALVPRSAA